MDAVFAGAIILFKTTPIFWTGVVLWLLGFATYVPAACGRGRPRVLGKAGIVLCWLGFALTLLAHFVLDEVYRAPRFERPTLEWAYWFRSSTQIWMLWIIGGALVIASGLRWFTARVGWLGLTAIMVGSIASWFTDAASQQVVIEIGAGIVAVLLAVLAWRDDLLPREARARRAV
jgi:hypothetical protein